MQQRGFASSGWHPVHMHVNHFQIVDYQFGYEGEDQINEKLLFRRGEWRDVLPIMDGLHITVRFRVENYTGPILTHCQLPRHQDQGMIRLARVVSEEEVPEGFYLAKTIAINDHEQAPENLLGGYFSTDVSWSFILSILSLHLRIFILMTIVLQSIELDSLWNQTHICIISSTMAIPNVKPGFM